MKKKCFKCGRTKDIRQFYKHPMMADGHLGKCKSCTKKDAATRYADPVSKEKIREYERARFMDPERKKKAMGYQRKRRKNRPGKEAARRKISNGIRDGRVERKPCEVCGAEKAQAHHDDYRKPLEVRWLCFKHHREHHKQKVMHTSPLAEKATGRYSEHTYG